MATVKITGNVRNHIVNEIAARFEKRIVKHREALTNVSMRWQEPWPDSLVPHIEAVKDYVECRSVYYVTLDGHNIDVKLDPIGPLPNAPRNGRYDRCKAPASVVDFCMPHITEINSVAEERDAFIKEVKGVLSKFTTINQALKSWPPLENILPKEILQRVREKRAPAEKVEVEATTSQSLNTALLKLRVMS